MHIEKWKWKKIKSLDYVVGALVLSQMVVFCGTWALPKILGFCLFLLLLSLLHVLCLFHPAWGPPLPLAPPVDQPLGQLWSMVLGGTPILSWASSQLLTFRSSLLHSLVWPCSSGIHQFASSKILLAPLHVQPNNVSKGHCPHLSAWGRTCAASHGHSSYNINVLYDPISHEMHVVQQFNMVIGCIPWKDPFVSCSSWKPPI